jgi:hypothetical protein
MGALLSYFGRPYAAIGGSVGAIFADESGYPQTREKLVPRIEEMLNDEQADLHTRAEALVLLHALETCFTENLFVFVDDMLCPYTETRLRSTLTEALIRKYPSRSIVAVGPEVIDIHVPSAPENFSIGADSFWLLVKHEGPEAAGSHLQAKLAEHALPDPCIFSTNAAPPVPGIETLTAIDRARLFDAVARDNVALADAAPTDRCTTTYVQTDGYTRWITNDAFGSRRHGTTAAMALLAKMPVSDAEREFAALKL